MENTFGTPRGKYAKSNSSGVMSQDDMRQKASALGIGNGYGGGGDSQRSASLRQSLALEDDIGGSTTTDGYGLLLKFKIHVNDNYSPSGTN